MNEPWLERFWVWLCSVIGHRFDTGTAWMHAGLTHKVCSRCNRIISGAGNG